MLTYLLTRPTSEGPLELEQSSANLVADGRATLVVVDYRGRSGGMRVMCVRAGMRVSAEGGHAFGTDGVALGSPAAEETSPAPGCSCGCHGGDVGAAGSSSEHFDLFDVGCLWLMYVCVCVCKIVKVV